MLGRYRINPISTKFIQISQSDIKVQSDREWSDIELKSSTSDMDNSDIKSNIDAHLCMPMIENVT